MTQLFRRIGFVTLTLIFAFQGNAQTTENASKIAFNPYDGTIVMGYVDNGAYLNFTGPNISFSKGKSKVMLGMLPSLRYKEDHSVIKNAPITPNLGVGLTFCYKKAAIQIPLYYNSKTSTANGFWTLGVGLGFRFK